MASYGANSIFSYSARLAEGGAVSLASRYAGHVTLVVNTASMCGFTAVQMPQLQRFQDQFGAGSRSSYGQHPFTVLAFPCAQFANQEPLSGPEACTWAERTFKTTFPIFDKTLVKGPNADPLWAMVAAELGAPPRWNFCKYLCDHNGVPKRRFDHTVPDIAIEAAIRNLTR